MKLKYIMILLVILLSIAMLGCSKRQNKADQFVNYFAKEEKIIEQFAQNYKEAKNKIAQEKDLRDLSRDIDQIIKNCKENRDAVNKLPTPVELLDYNTATNKYMNTTINSLREIKLIIESYETESISTLNQKFQEIDKTKAVQEKDMDLAIKKAVREAGIEFKRDGDKIYFR